MKSPLCVDLLPRHRNTTEDVHVVAQLVPDVLWNALQQAALIFAEDGVEQLFGLPQPLRSRIVDASHLLCYELLKPNLVPVLSPTLVYRHPPREFACSACGVGAAQTRQLLPILAELLLAGVLVTVQPHLL